MYKLMSTEQLPAGPRRQVIIEERTLFICPHCWTVAEVRSLYPQLLVFPLRERLCSAHFNILVARGVELAAIVTGNIQNG